LEESKIVVEFSVKELEILIHALGTANPTDKDFEVMQFRLYHKILFKLNENKK